jgi:hypothetical protein
MCAISEAVNDELVAEGRHKFVIVRLSGSCARIGTHKSACDSPTSGLCVMRVARWGGALIHVTTMSDASSWSLQKRIWNRRGPWRRDTALRADAHVVG